MDEFARIEDHGIARFTELLKEALPGKPWLAWPEDNPWGSLQAWCRSLFGVPWGSVLVIIEQIDKDLSRELALIVGEEQAGSVRAGNPTGENQWTKDDGGIADNVSNSSGRAHKHGNDPAYLLRRLTRLANSNSPKVSEEKREAAREALEGFRNGTIQSAFAAGKKAGIVKPPTPLQDLKRAWRKASEQERAEFEVFIRQERERSAS